MSVLKRALSSISKPKLTINDLLLNAKTTGFNFDRAAASPPRSRILIAKSTTRGTKALSVNY